ncbi:MAG: DEAD/DEAH box helicase family protein [Treponema sp.]|nr:DEAD/DEAH box helicase family protein [Treponema sp.]
MYSNENNSMESYMIIEGHSLEECRVKLFKKYGDRFKIVDYEKFVTNGILGIGQKEMLRVYYILKQFNPNPENDRRPFNDRMQANRMESQPYNMMGSGPGRGVFQPSAAQPQFSQYSARGASASMGGYSPSPSRGAPIDGDFASVKDALLKKLTGNVDIVKQFGQIQKKMDGMEYVLEELKNMSSGKNVHPSIKKIDSILENNEFTKKYIEDMNLKIGRELSVEDLEDFDLVQRKVIEWICESIAIAPRYPKRSSKIAHTIILVGPTGVGKTITVAKMAATIMKQAKKSKLDPPKIVMITTDRDRVAAKEQLEHYASIMGADFFEALTEEDFTDLYSSYSTKSDFIFVDTCGYSPRDVENIGKLHSLLNVDEIKADIYLAISATTKASDLETILKNYDTFSYRSVIVTKCDETETFGNVLSTLNEKKKPISLIAYGQKTLNTMQSADPSYFINRLHDFTIDKDRVRNILDEDDDEEENQEGSL